MSFREIISILLVLAGAGLMVASLFYSLKSTASVPDTLRLRWRIMSHLIIFFLGGYILFAALKVRRLPISQDLLTGIIFFGGALFVFLVIQLSRNTIRQLHEGQVRINTANQALLKTNEELNQEITARRQAEKQARSRLQHLAALHAIDTIITSSLDLRVTLKVFLEQVTPQLNVHASDVLLFNPYTQYLEYAAGQGFKTTVIQSSRERLGEGSAGIAAMDRRVVSIPCLRESVDSFNRQELLEEEGFASYFAVPLVAKGQIKGVLEIFHREELKPDPEWFDFLEALAVQAAIAIDNSTLFNDLQRSNAELILAYDTTIEGWARALELRDEETEGHTQRVTEMTMRMARNFGMNEEELVHVRRGALLHDIGKMAISDSILMKHGPLTSQEIEIMKQHPVHAFEMLSPISYLRPALDIPYCHHERWDGSGYPRGLKELQIPLSARIFAVADTWDALRYERRYHKPWALDKVREQIVSLSGIHFDPEVVKIFLETELSHLEDESRPLKSA